MKSTLHERDRVKASGDLRMKFKIRKNKTTVRDNYFYENLNSPCMYPLEPNQHSFVNNFPVTRYWSTERRAIINGLIVPKLPKWFSGFDWLLGFQHGWAIQTNNPRTVFCHPDCIGLLLKELKRVGRPDSKRAPESFLVVGGEDRRISTQRRKTIIGLRKYFNTIYYEAYDRLFQGVEVMPIGLTEFYLREHEKKFQEIFQRVNFDTPRKKLLLAAWGKWWPQLDKWISDRRMALEFSKSCPFCTSGRFPPDEWFECLAEHHYMLCPEGNGVQSPKMFESILFGCIPICSKNAASESLLEKGMPILLVDDWYQITEEFLLQHLDGLLCKVKRFGKESTSIEGYWRFSYGYPFQYNC